MGRISDEIYDKMWDEVYCKKHNTTQTDSRFKCEFCEQERLHKKEIDTRKARKLLEDHGLAHIRLL